MKSFDTNILIYAINEAAPEHEQAKRFVTDIVANPDDWILAEQVLIEVYCVLRNPAVFRKPLSSEQAWDIIDFYRANAGLQICCYELAYWAELGPILRSPGFPAKRTFDAMLAVTLRANRVELFYTRNTNDFDRFGFETVSNPID